MQYRQNLGNNEQILLDPQKLRDALAVIFTRYPHITQILADIFKAAGKAYLVGGAVRDLLLGRPIHDLDIEVHALTMDQLSALLQKFGEVSAVGKSFGVLKLAGSLVDWSLPRTDTAGRKPDVSVNPHMDITEALRRRDLTMNALAIDLQTQTLIDPFDGVADIQKRILRSPDSTFFKEDPLRFYRVMQFIGRFEMHPDDELNAICKTMDISHVSIERIEDEFEKLLLKSIHPSLGIRWLASISRIGSILPELAHTRGVKQDPQWHPEGDVFEHLMQALDAAAVLSYKNHNEKLIGCYAALCHDLGKVSTSIIKEGRIRSPGHAEAGVPLTFALLRRITHKNKIIDSCAVLVKYHMQPGQFVKLHSTLAAYRRLAVKIAKYTTIDMLAKLVLADYRGRAPHGHEPLTKTPHFLTVFLRRAREAQALTAPEKPALLGRDIADLVSAGPEMGKLLHYAYELQLDEGIRDKNILRQRIVEKLKAQKG